MPVKSAKQMRFMRAASEGKSNNPFGPSKEVAKEFIAKTPVKKRKLFGKKQDESTKSKIRAIGKG